MNVERIEQNGFRLLEQIDSTSRTVVWKAIQETLDRSVIIRILKPEFSANATEVSHFLSTARLFARIKSDSIAAVFDIVSEGDLHYVVGEHVDGPTLEELVNTQGPLPVEQALRIASSIVVSLDQMWSQANIVHRNLKSSVIRLDNRSVAKITDFNLAIQVKQGIDVTAMDDGLIVGTPCFLSPEQAQGAHTLTTQSDMYALGSVLYHLTTGHAPFENEAPVDILAAHVHRQIPPPHRLNRKIPVVFSWFVHRLMMKAPANRYATWDDVLQDIRNILAGATPVCVKPEDEALSTIENHFENDALSQERRRENAHVRLNRRRKHSALNAQASADSQKQPESPRTHHLSRNNERMCWGALAVWLLCVFGYRTILETDDPDEADESTPPSVVLSGTPDSVVVNAAKKQAPKKTSKLRLPILSAITHKTAKNVVIKRPPPPVHPTLQTPAPLPKTPVPYPPPSAQPKTAAAPVKSAHTPPATATATAEAEPAGIPPALARSLAQALAKPDLAAAQQALKNSANAFKEKESLQTLLNQIPPPETLVAEYLKTQIGKPLVFEHNGKQRTVIPRSVENNVVQLEFNGRGAEFPLEKLTADEKLNWMNKPSDAPRTAAYCLALMHSARKDEVHARATACPLLADVLNLAAELASSAESEQRP